MSLRAPTELVERLSEPPAQVSMDRDGDDVSHAKRFRRALSSRRPRVGRLWALEDHDDRSTMVDVEACRGRDRDRLGGTEVHSRQRRPGCRFNGRHELYLLWPELRGSQGLLHGCNRAHPVAVVAARGDEDGSRRDQSNAGHQNDSATPRLRHHPPVLGIGRT